VHQLPLIHGEELIAHDRVQPRVQGDQVFVADGIQESDWTPDRAQDGQRRSADTATSLGGARDHGPKASR
jgi:hypothetical protein